MPLPLFLIVEMETVFLTMKCSIWYVIITIIIMVLLFCIFANKKQLAVLYYWHLLCIEQVVISWPQILLLTLPPPLTL